MGNILHNTCHNDVSKTPVGKGNTSKMTQGQVVQLLNSSGIPRVYMMPSDCLALDKGNVKKFFKEDGSDYLDYVKERSDCDNFTWVAQGRITENVLQYGSNNNCKPLIGEVSGNIVKKPGEDSVAHSMLFAIINEDSGPRVYLIEPQNDKWYDPNGESKYWYAMIY